MIMNKEGENGIVDFGGDGDICFCEVVFLDI